MLLKRPLNQTVAVAASTSGQIDLPVDRYIKRILLKFTIAFTTPSTAVETSEGGILNLVKQIKVVANGNQTIHDVSLKDLYILNVLTYGKTPIDRSSVTDEPGSQGLTGFQDNTDYKVTFGIMLDMYKKSPLFNVELGTFFPALKYETLTLNVVFNAATAVFTTAMGAAFSGTLKAIIEESEENLGNTAIVKTLVKEFSIAGTQSNYEILLERAENQYLDLLFFRGSHTATTTDSHTDVLINNLRLMENSNNLVIDYDEECSMFSHFDKDYDYGYANGTISVNANKNKTYAGCLKGLNLSRETKGDNYYNEINMPLVEFDTQGRLKNWYSMSPSRLTRLGVLIDTDVTALTAPKIRMIQRTIEATPDQLNNIRRLASM